MDETHIGIGKKQPDLSSGELIQYESWTSNRRLSIVHAALLIVGCNPNQVASVEYLPADMRPEGYQEIRNMLRSALVKREIEGNPLKKTTTNQEAFKLDRGLEYSEYDPATSLLITDSLKVWLAERGIPSWVFGIVTDSLPEYLDPDHPRYSQKLGAAIAAWQAMKDESFLKNRRPKAAIGKWLETNAEELGLVKQDGTINKDAINQIATVCNWDTKGGAPKTSG